MKTEMDFYMLLIFLMLSSSFIKETIAQTCPRFLFTEVDRCPRNALEWEARAAILNCTAVNQTCVELSLLEYHCVLNKDANGLVEVCAPSRRIFEQKCAEFNSYGNLIQESFVNCSEALVPCLKPYRSREAYKYQSCYDFVHQSKKQEETNNQHSHDSIKSTASETIIILGLLTATFGTVILVIVLFYSKKRMSVMNRERSKPDVNNGENVSLQ